MELATDSAISQRKQRLATVKFEKRLVGPRRRKMLLVERV
jgi:hypothetical protein